MSTRRAAASRSAAAIDASTLLFQREALSNPAALERVSGAHWDPVFADGIALCDELGLFQCVAIPVPVPRALVFRAGCDCHL